MAHEEHHEEIDTEETPPATHGFRNFLVVIIILAILGVTGYILLRRKPASNQQPSNTADQIRNSFSPPSTTNPSFNPPAPSQQFGGTLLPSTTTPANPPVSTFPKPIPRSPAATAPRTVTPRTPAAPTVYQNPNLGFALTLPANWVAGQSSSPNQAVFFDRNTGQMVGYVETYSNASESVDSLSIIFSNSPDVHSVSRTIVAGQPALSYCGFDSGIAVIFNNRIYYLHGSLSNPTVASKFRFI